MKLNKTDTLNLIEELMQKVPCAAVSTNHQGLVFAEVPLEWFDMNRALIGPSKFPHYFLMQQSYTASNGFNVFFLRLIDAEERKFLTSKGYFKNA